MHFSVAFEKLEALYITFKKSINKRFDAQILSQMLVSI